MPPIRTHDSGVEASSSKPHNETKNKRKRHHQYQQHDQESAAPGISRIKSSLRQTRRLLAKDKLAADVRVETERRLKALEAELAQAEIAKKERTLATRYHKIKFFERQKVIRKINQTKTQLSAATKESARRKLKTTLYDLRVDLNYILHYPKLKKYISLFPPEIRKNQSAPATAEEDTAKTAQAREEVHSWVRSCMEEGKLSKEPELEQSSNVRYTSKAKDWGGVPGKSSKAAPVQDTDNVEQDEFFGDDGEEES